LTDKTQFSEFELDLRRAVDIALTDKGHPPAVHYVMKALIKVEKRLAALEKLSGDHPEIHTDNMDRIVTRDKRKYEIGHGKTL